MGQCAGHGGSQVLIPLLHLPFPLPIMTPVVSVLFPSLPFTFHQMPVVRTLLLPPLCL